MKTSTKIALALAAGLLIAIGVSLLAGCAAPRPVPVVPNSAVGNRPLGELNAIAAGRIPEPADLSPADRVTLSQLRQAR